MAFGIINPGNELKKSLLSHRSTSMATAAISSCTVSVGNVAHHCVLPAEPGLQRSALFEIWIKSQHLVQLKFMQDIAE